MKKKDRQIKKLEKEAARSHAETIDVRNKWFQTCEDVLEEKERELQEMEKRMLDAFRQRDEALDKLRKKNAELSDIKIQLYEAQGTITQLTARINKDYTNSSKPSSADPNHGKIHNNREVPGRRPGGLSPSKLKFLSPAQKHQIKISSIKYFLSERAVENGAFSS